MTLNHKVIDSEMIYIEHYGHTNYTGNSSEKKVLSTNQFDSLRPSEVGQCTYK